MKRSSIFAATAAACCTLFAATPAFAQTYDDPFGPAFGMFFLFCWGIMALIGLALLALNIWMLVDVIQRQEYEFPGSTGSSKTLWLVLLILGLVIGFGWIVALVYYFQVFKKIRRGSAAPTPPQPQTYTPPPPQEYDPPKPQVYDPPPAPPQPPAPPAPDAPPSEESRPE